MLTAAQTRPDELPHSLYLQNEQLKESCALLERQLKAIITREQLDVGLQVGSAVEAYPRSLVTGECYYFLPYAPGLYLPAVKEGSQHYRLALTRGFSERQRCLLQDCSLVVCARVAQITCEGEVIPGEVVALLGFEEDDMLLRNYA